MFTLVLSALLAAPAAGATRYVDDNTCPQAGNGTQANPYCKIQDAICAAVASDTVSVAPGAYLEAVRMKPGVSLISQGGAAVTTISSAGQPCTDSNYCTKRTGNQCSVVTFASGHSSSTILDGFTLQGGAGTIQTSLVGGGGLFLFSSPTVRNNIITNNIVSGPRNEWDGGGVIITSGSPIVTNNVISGNRVVPAAGISGSPTYAYGGGVFIGWNTSPTLTNNTISNNVAGDSNVAFSLGSGGGIALWPGDANRPNVVVDRNTITGNSADTMGGGVNTGSLFGTFATAVITNNVITGNSTYLYGGGAYVYFNKTSLVNNTIRDNESKYGGGVYSGQGDVTLPVVISNNAIVGNRLQDFGNGGGIYHLDLDPIYEPSFENNDLFGNERNNVGGERSDADTIGVTGNFSLAPQFLDEAAGDYHLDPNSPLIDRALASRAPPVDRDNLPRGIDGNGTPDNPVAGDVDVGAYEFIPGCVPGPEICDGLDNNCNTQVDEGFLNTDGDSLADCVDPDDDNDGVADGSDCAPLDGGVTSAPGEVTNVDIPNNPPTVVTYQTTGGIATTYHVVSGHLTRLSIIGGYEEDFCAAAYGSGGAWTDTRPDPPLGEGWFYMIRGLNSCGVGGFNNPYMVSTRTADVCFNGIVDLDNDGSPSDLDCADNDPAVSPAKPEQCNGVDDNCVGGADEGNPGGGAQCGVSNTGECRLGLTACVSGAVVCEGAVFPQAESCDGKDNDCNNLTDEGFADFDLDNLADCVDLDDDNDFSLDGSDCAPLDATAFGSPFEVANVLFSDNPPHQISWTSQNIGVGTMYEISTGLITLSGSVDFAPATCLPSVSASPIMDTAADPPVDQARYYLVKSRNACGGGTYGSAARDASPACP